MRIYNTLIPYETIPHYEIVYGVCRDFTHISRYNNLRQVTHTYYDDSLTQYDYNNYGYVSDRWNKYYETNNMYSASYVSEKAISRPYAVYEYDQYLHDFIALETTNAFATNMEVDYYEVPYDEENRLDLIAYKFLGNASYSWIIAYINRIEDGFSVYAGQRIMIPKSWNSLFNKGELLAPVAFNLLNLKSE